ncbi:MAG: HAD-IIB family hydrolase [Candidatus Eremiobacteraeota bacterium]|nr:HAD-IIB family hydrolase [Candidatus Eremiobacteraeota bacterium]
MRYLALATDFDGTLAHDSRVSQNAIDALKRLRESGRHLVLVTGRILPDLEREFSALELFDFIVAENGALLYDPKRKTSSALADPVSQTLVQRLKDRGVSPIEVGHSIVATWQPHEQAVLDTIAELGLELQIIFNKGAVMVLPSGINKASGLSAALEKLGLSPHNVAGIGDAENDHAFLSLCECSAAVANALPALKETADVVMRGDHGHGVVELAQAMLQNDLAELSVRADRLIEIGHIGARTVTLDPYQAGALIIAGRSGGGKSTVAFMMIERLIEAKYQLFVVDPEGDYDVLKGAIVLGDADHAPSFDEVNEVLERPDESVVVNLLALAMDERTRFFAELLGRIQGLRARYGRPHWIVLDEAHHLLPKGHDIGMPADLWSLMLLTVDPATLSEEALRAVRTVVAVGEEPAETLRHAVGSRAPVSALPALPKLRVALWKASAPDRIDLVDVHEPRDKKKRHRRKYATGDLAPEKSFYFRGPQGKLNLRAENLETFTKLAEGIDDETWQYHVANGDLARWFKEMIDDAELAEIAENARSMKPAESRKRLIEEIEKRYTASAT